MIRLRFARNFSKEEPMRDRKPSTTSLLLSTSVFVLVLTLTCLFIYTCTSPGAIAKDSGKEPDADTVQITLVMGPQTLENGSESSSCMVTIYSKTGLITPYKFTDFIANLLFMANGPFVLVDLNNAAILGIRSLQVVTAIILLPLVYNMGEVTVGLARMAKNNKQFALAIVQSIGAVACGWITVFEFVFFAFCVGIIEFDSC